MDHHNERALTPYSGAQAHIAKLQERKFGHDVTLS